MLKEFKGWSSIIWILNGDVKMRHLKKEIKAREKLGLWNVLIPSSMAKIGWIKNKKEKLTWKKVVLSLIFSLCLLTSSLIFPSVIISFWITSTLTPSNSSSLPSYLKYLIDIAKSSLYQWHLPSFTELLLQWFHRANHFHHSISDTVTWFPYFFQ